MLDEGKAYTLRRRETYEHLTAMDDLEALRGDSIPAPRAEAHR
jgi:hypothetical protein